MSIQILAYGQAIKTSHSHRLIIEGFNETRLGYNFHTSGIDLSFTGSILDFSKRSSSVQGAIAIGKVFRIQDSVDITIGPKLLASHTSKTMVNDVSYSSETFLPSLTIGGQRPFSRFIVGGTIGLNYWEITRYNYQFAERTWYPNRRMNLTASFLLGIGL